VSAFGFSGTNAHAVVEEPPVAPSPAAQRAVAAVGPLEAALTALAQRYERALRDAPPQQLAAVCRAAATGRSHHPYRAAYVAGVRVPSAGAPRTGKALRVGVAFGAPDPDARALHASEPLFRDAFAQCAVPLAALDTDAGRFAAAFAWAQLWQAWGIRPAVVTGHGVGEYVAACVAGVLSIADALRVLAVRADAAAMRAALHDVRLARPTVRLISAASAPRSPTR
jgi:acyl transferase domain-containing protein